MEYLVALLVLGATVGYAVFIAVNIEKGKRWALEIARAISLMDPNSVDCYLRYESKPEAATEESPAEETAKLAA